MTGPLPPDQPSVTVILLTYNSQTDLGPFFASLRRQKFQNFKVIVIDNASTDDSPAVAARLWPAARLLVNSTNLGYAGGHNVGLGLVSTEYVLVANPDVILADNFLEKSLQTMRDFPDLGSVGGKIWRLTDVLNYDRQRGIIDSTGLVVHRNRRFVDRGQGEYDRGQYDADGPVFGISGALALYRAAALRSVRLSGGNIFDERYFMYQEDIDLAWRLQHFGWPARYTHAAQAWHRRAAAGADRSSDREIAARRRAKPALVNYWSYRNHLYTLLKNERRADFARDGWRVLWYEFKKLVYLFMFERRTLSALVEVWRQRRGILIDRRIIQAQGRCNLSGRQT